MKVHLEFAKQHLKNSYSIRKMILGSEETETEPFDQNSKDYVWQTPGTVHHLAKIIYSEPLWWQHHAIC